MGIYLNPNNNKFKKVVNSSIYVDKSLLIQYINTIINTNEQYLCVTRPRRFGKTLALDMLKSYFEKTEDDTSVYFRDKKIWSCGEKYQKYQELNF